MKKNDNGNFSMDLTYISKGNSKTETFSFDLPAGDTCPCETFTCGNKCYAKGYMRLYPRARKKYERNYVFAESDGFVAYMIKNIPQDAKFRIHVSGDFYSTAYIVKWIQIVSTRQDVTFYAYTRSWRSEDLWWDIRRLQYYPNTNINLSCDVETGCPLFEDYRWAYLTHDDTIPSWLRKKDLVFRSKHSGHKRRIKNAIAKGNVPPPIIHNIIGIRVCPLERGVDIDISCASCMICIDKPKVLIW